MSRIGIPRSLLLVVATAVGCYSEGSTGIREGELGAEIEVGLGQEFSLEPGQMAHVRGTEVLIFFDRILDDSRCPSDVQCPWQGNAAARLELSSRIAEFAPQEVVLNTGVEPRARTMLGVTVRLVDVAPYPRTSDPPIDPPDYTIKLVVTRG